MKKLFQIYALTTFFIYGHHKVFISNDQLKRHICTIDGLIDGVSPNIRFTSRAPFRMSELLERRGIYLAELVRRKSQLSPGSEQYRLISNFLVHHQCNTCVGPNVYGGLKHIDQGVER